ncbi:ABC-F family ATP-binding cassette domain-containing protein [Pedobacter antarcticus]|uniref:ABC-F family ATP-binding cassette domain-containing protein n=1 Tax=Pedobacter antarcticus TaxID=34086 RepID=UPI001C584A68|nr:ABC-F family ATP-binding cassette domain-containing protein [Pedobacter antarcticus]
MSLIIKSLTYIHPDNEELFRGLSMAIPDGEKASLVGINGMGKSTLLQMVAGLKQQTSGEIHTSEKPWYVPQHLGDYDHVSLVQALAVDKKLNALHAILAGDADTQNFTALDDDWEIDKKVEMALKKWGLDHVGPEQKLGSLSGGQKTKVFLAAIDLHHPQIILLDEPSNHLDAQTRNKLYELIKQIKATVLVVSHDKALLNMMDKTLEMNQKGIEVFGGNYEFYRQLKQEKVSALQAQLNDQAKTLKQTEKKARDMAYLRQKQEYRGKRAGQSNSLPRIIAGGLKSKSERSTAKVMNTQNEKISGLQDTIQETKSRIQQYQTLKIDIRSSGLHHGKLLVDLEKINFGYRTPLLQLPLSFQLRSGDRVHVKGNNGSGKTTLLMIITGQLEPLSGNCMRSDFSYLYLDQDYALIKPDLSIYDQVQQYNALGLQEHEIKALLVHSQFDGENFDRKCRGLSGGEKMKLSLCCLSVSNQTVDILILDEPTNNLDVQSLEVLTSAIKNYQGTLVVISHDAYFTTEIGISRQINLS